MNPYATSDLVISARAAGAEVSEAHFFVTPSVYPPTAFLLLSPLAALPWAVARAIWLFGSLGISILAAAGLARMARGWALPVWSFILAFAPLHTGISKGQPSVLVCALIVLSIVTQRPYIAGLLLGMAVCIKPQLALGFVFLAVVRHQVGKIITVCCTGLFVGGGALVCMKLGSLNALISNLSAAGSPSGINSGSALNHLRFQLINVDALIPQALYSTPVMAIVYAIIASVSAIAVLRVVDTRMSVAVVASATVLVGYHRFYDAQILWLGIPYLLSSARGRMSLLLRASYLAFLIPGQTMAAMWLNSRTDGPWSLLLLRHENAACLVVWLIFAGTAIKRSGCQRERASAADSSIA